MQKSDNRLRRFVMSPFDLATHNKLGKMKRPTSSVCSLFVGLAATAFLPCMVATMETTVRRREVRGTLSKSASNTTWEGDVLLLDQLSENTVRQQGRHTNEVHPTADFKETGEKTADVVSTANPQQRATEEVFQKATKIVGGNDADLGEYLYFVEWGGCGGTLIAPDVVLSAAHCDPGFAFLTAGAYELSTITLGSAPRVVSDWMPHPSYNEDTDEFDFALLKLESHIPTIEPVQLNFDDDVPQDGQTLTVIGLGTLEFEGPRANILQEVEVDYVPSSDCNEVYGGRVVDDIMFCAGVPGGGKDSCQGDSGGPVLIKGGGDDGRDLQVGVVSWGIGCGLPGIPGINSRISGTSWIKEQACTFSRTGSDLCGFGGNGVGNGTSSINCANNELNFYLELHTDDFAAETSWKLVNDRTGDDIEEVTEFDNDSYYEYEKCIPRDCYTLMLIDSFEDGLCCGGQDTGYSLKVDGDTIENGGLELWGSTREIKFGTCRGAETPAPVLPDTPAPVVATPVPVNGTSPEDCAPITIEFKTDHWPMENYYSLSEKGVGVNRIERGLFFGSNKQMDSGTKYAEADCLPRSACWVFDFTDEQADNIAWPGHLTLTYDGAEWWNSRLIGYGILAEMGDGC